MKYYKVIYTIGSNNERMYPSSIKGAVWNMVQYHSTDNAMIGGTESRIEPDGTKVIELTEDRALSLVEEFKKSYPRIPGDELPFLLEEKDEIKSARTRSSKKKSGNR